MEKMIIAAVGFLFIFLIILKMVFYIMEWKSELRYLKTEVERSQTRKEREYWKFKLSAVKLSFLPGVSVDGAEKFIRWFTK